MKKAKNKHYREAYNNPNQYNLNFMIENLEKCDDEKTIKVISMAISGLRDALNDRKNGTYQYIRA